MIERILCLKAFRPYIKPMDIRFFALRDVPCKTRFLCSPLFNYLQIDVAFKFVNCYNNYIKTYNGPSMSLPKKYIVSVVKSSETIRHCLPSRTPISIPQPSKRIIPLKKLIVLFEHTHAWFYTFLMYSFGGT